jgi:transcriptional regulator with GAF, ATPase, and Fis domain
VPEKFIEDELFGYKKAVFTRTAKKRLSKIAKSGKLF